MNVSWLCFGGTFKSCIDMLKDFLTYKNLQKKTCYKICIQLTVTCNNLYFKSMQLYPVVMNYYI